MRGHALYPGYFSHGEITSVRTGQLIGCAHTAGGVRFGQDENILPPTWNRTPDRPSRSTVTKPTELTPSKHVSMWHG